MDKTKRLEEALNQIELKGFELAIVRNKLMAEFISSHDRIDWGDDGWKDHDVNVWELGEAWKALEDASARIKRVIRRLGP